MKIYIQIGKGSKSDKIHASLKQPKQVLHNGQQGRWREYYPTITFAVEVQLPPDAFELGEKVVADINLTNEQLRTSDFEVKVIKE